MEYSQRAGKVQQDLKWPVVLVHHSPALLKATHDSA